MSDEPRKKEEGLIERTLDWVETCIFDGIRRQIREMGNYALEHTARIVLALVALVLATVFLSLAIVVALEQILPLPLALAIGGALFALVGILFWKTGRSAKKK
ncbi:MAG: hypothetical protein RDV41_02330 [Planctomycetota bacterium]|nr:hypothetical protein [Planctomycetota bacterium]